ncbi:MAG: permease prefix domain 1-containing protein [Rhodoglobus sp.]
MAELDTDIALWRTSIMKGRAVDDGDADELESHLREQLAELKKAGLTDSEAFQIAVQRLGKADQLTAEFAREHGERLWKQLAMSASPEPTDRRPLVKMIVFALIAAVAMRVGWFLASTPTAMAPWFLRDLSLFVLPVLFVYLARQRRMPRRTLIAAAAAIVALAALATLYPFTPDGQTTYLVGIHLPVLLWFIVGIAYLGGIRTPARRRMEFVRFTGEFAIYLVLLILGGGVLTGLTVMVLNPIVPGAVDDVLIWVVPSGGAAAVIVAAWLVEAKKSVIENLAPVLAAVFTPLFAVMLGVAAIVYAVGGIGRNFDRNLLTGFDILLIIVLGLVLYALSARDTSKPAGALDVVRLVAISAALLVDLLVLWSMVARVVEYGFTPNRAAALGLNLILVINLAVTAWLFGRMLARRTTAEPLERWQTQYLPVFGAWAALVVVVLPLLFAFS